MRGLSPETVLVVERLLDCDGGCDPELKHAVLRLLREGVPPPQTQDLGGKRLLTANEACRYLGISRTTFWRMRQDPTRYPGLAPTMAGEGVQRFDRANLDAHLLQQAAAEAPENRKT